MNQRLLTYGERRTVWREQMKVESLKQYAAVAVIVVFFATLFLN